MLKDEDYGLIIPARLAGRIAFPDVKPSLLLKHASFRAWVAACGVVFVSFTVGCRDAKQKALLELEHRSLSPTPQTLHEAVEREDLKVIGFLGVAEVKAGLPEVGKPSVLQVAAARQSWPLVAELMSFCDPTHLNHAGPEQKVILEQAVFAGQLGLAHRLVEAGAKPEAVACGADILVQKAASEPAVMDVLLAALPEGHPALAPALIRAVVAGETDRVQRLLDHKALPTATGAVPPATAPANLAAPNASDSSSATSEPNALVGSAQDEKAPASSLAKDEPTATPGAPTPEAAPSTAEARKAPALELACLGGFQPIAAALVKAGARPNEAPGALVAAVNRGDLALSTMLLQAGALPEAPADSAQPESNPLTLTLTQGKLELTDLLLKHGASPARCLEYALTQGNSKLLDLLQQHGTPLDQPGPNGDPPLVRAAIAGQGEIVQALLDRGVPRDVTGALGQTAFHMAVIHRRSDVIDRLLAAGAKVDEPFVKPAPAELLPAFESEYFVKWYKRDGNLTPLMLAAARGDVPQLQQLLRAGAKRGAQTTNWHRYPIIFACDNVHLSTAHVAAAQVLLGRNPAEEKEKRHAVISLSRQRVTLYKNNQAVRSSRVSTGKRSTPTPAGKYVITDKQVSWISSIYNVPMPFFMRLSCKEIGMHAGALPGYPASHGCIRMPKGEVQAFFRVLRIGDPVTIEP